MSEQYTIEEPKQQQQAKGTDEEYTIHEPSPETAIPVAEMRAAPSAWESFKGAVKHPISYLSDVESDVTEGGGRTVVGRSLGHMQHGSLEDTGYEAPHEEVAPIIAGPLQGPPKIVRGGLRMAEDVKEHLIHPITSYEKSQAGEPDEFVSGLNEAATGAMQTAGPLAYTSPTALPRIVAGTLAAKGVEKGLGYIGVPEEYRELAANIAGGAAAGAPEVAEAATPLIREGAEAVKTSPTVQKAVRGGAKGVSTVVKGAPGALVGGLLGEIAGGSAGVPGLGYIGGALGDLIASKLPSTALEYTSPYERFGLPVKDYISESTARQMEDVGQEIPKNTVVVREKEGIPDPHRIVSAEYEEARRDPMQSVRAIKEAKKAVKAERTKFGGDEKPEDGSPEDILGRVEESSTIPESAPSPLGRIGAKTAESASVTSEPTAVKPSLRALQEEATKSLSPKTRLANEGTRSGIFGHETHVGPDSTEFHVEDKNGVVHVFNVEGGPEQAKALERMSWQQIKNEPGVTHIAKISSEGVRTPDRPSIKTIIKGEKGELGAPGTVFEDFENKPQYSQASDENSTTHTVRYGNATIEGVEFKDQPGVITITGADAGSAKGTGQGFTAYEYLAKQAAKQGKELRSGGSIGPEAKANVARVWNRLAQVGFDVQQDAKGNFYIPAEKTTPLGRISAQREAIKKSFAPGGEMNPVSVSELIRSERGEMGLPGSVGEPRRAITESSRLAEKYLGQLQKERPELVSEVEPETKEPIIKGPQPSVEPLAEAYMRRQRLGEHGVLPEEAENAKTSQEKSEEINKAAEATLRKHRAETPSAVSEAKELPSIPLTPEDEQAIVTAYLKELWRREHGEAGKPGSVGGPFKRPSPKQYFEDTSKLTKALKKGETVGEQTGKTGYSGVKEPPLGPEGSLSEPRPIVPKLNKATVEEAKPQGPTSTERWLSDLRKEMEEFSKTHPPNEEKLAEWRQKIDERKAQQAEEESRTSSPEFKRSRRVSSAAARAAEAAKVARERVALEELDSQLRALEVLGEPYTPAKPEGLPKGYKWPAETPEEEAARLKRKSIGEAKKSHEDLLKSLKASIKKLEAKMKK